MKPSVIFLDYLQEMRKTKYDLSTHRFRELREFCLQYPNWKELYLQTDGWNGRGDVTQRDGIRRADLITNIRMIEECADSTDRDILRFVTVDGIILPSELWYQNRIFFWKLSQKRG